MNVFGKALLPLAAALLGLSGCQVTNDKGSGPGLGDAARALFAEKLGQAPEAPDARDFITAELLAQSPDPILMIVQKDLDTAGVLVPAGTGADGTVQWRDAGGAGLLLRSGILVGTRGIGFDLLTVDERGLLRALANGGAQGVSRTERRLSGDNTVETLTFTCDVASTGRETLTLYGSRYQTSRYEERCDGPYSFVNRYWIGGGLVRKSEVYVSAEAGILELTLLKN